jgi:DNA-binding MarR family transcriptional regulator
MLQYGVLRTLARGNLTIAELSKVMMVDPSTLVSVIDSLTRKSYAERKRDPNDRRRTPISITQKGLDIVKQHPDHGPFSAEDNPVVNSLVAMGEDKAEQLVNLLREVVFHMPEGAQILEHVANRVQYHEAELSKEHQDVE